MLYDSNDNPLPPPEERKRQEIQNLLYHIDRLASESSDDMEKLFPSWAGGTLEIKTEDDIKMSLRNIIMATRVASEILNKKGLI